jgi:hypothetical protein
MAATMNEPLSSPSPGGGGGGEGLRLDEELHRGRSQHCKVSFTIRRMMNV